MQPLKTRKDRDRKRKKNPLKGAFIQKEAHVGIHGMMDGEYMITKKRR